MTVRLSNGIRLHVGRVIHIRPRYEDSRYAEVRCWPKFRDRSLRWGQMQPEEPAVIMPLADWLLLAGIAAMVALSAVI